MDFVLFLRDYRTPFFDSFFQFITFWGNEEAYLLIVPLFYWIFDKSFGRQVIYVVTISQYLNTFVKDWFAIPRPFITNPEVNPVVTAEGYSFPSGHAMVSASLWGFIGWHFRKERPLIAWLIAPIIILIGLSRPYLGVHYPLDVAVGFTLGAMVVVLWLNLSLPLGVWLQTFNPSVVWLIVAGIPVLLMFVHPAGADGYPSENAATAAGILMGVNIGSFMENRHVRFSSQGTWQQYLLRYVLGLMLVVLFWAGLRVVFNMVEINHFLEMMLRFVRYTCAGCALTWWAPALFVRFGLAQQESLT